LLLWRTRIWTRVVFCGEMTALTKRVIDVARGEILENQ
jgi:hypothetical protein